MPKRHPIARKVYSPAEKAALVGEVQRRQRTESRSIDDLARQLGFTASSYYHWVGAGVCAPASEPAVACPSIGKTPTAEKRLKGARRYDDARRAALLNEIARRRETGQGIRQILAAVDLGRTTYARWLEQMAPVPAFRAVTVEDAPMVTAVALVPAVAVGSAMTPHAMLSAGPLTLVAPGGYRIEGLAVESAAALLRALS